MYIHIPHITIYIGYMGPYKLQYLHIHIHTETLDVCILIHTSDIYMHIHRYYKHTSIYEPYTY